MYVVSLTVTVLIVKEYVMKIVLNLSATAGLSEIAIDRRNAVESVQQQFTSKLSQIRSLWSKEHEVIVSIFPGTAAAKVMRMVLERLYMDHTVGLDQVMVCLTHLYMHVCIMFTNCYGGGSLLYMKITFGILIDASKNILIYLRPDIYYDIYIDIYILYTLIYRVQSWLLLYYHLWNSFKFYALLTNL